MYVFRFLVGFYMKGTWVYGQTSIQLCFIYGLVSWGSWLLNEQVDNLKSTSWWAMNPRIIPCPMNPCSCFMKLHPKKLLVWALDYDLSYEKGGPSIV